MLIFRKYIGPINGTDFFSSTGVIGIMDAEDYDNDDIISPFMQVIVDRGCDRDDSSVTPSY